MAGNDGVARSCGRVGSVSGFVARAIAWELTDCSETGRGQQGSIAISPY